MKKLLFSALMISTLCGCVMVPSSRIKFGGATAFLPKDWTAESIDISLTTGTNRMTFHATKMTTKNSPEVINASTAQLETAIRTSFQEGSKAIGTAAGAAAKTAVVP